jgi:hypothetical protein
LSRPELRSNALRQGYDENECIEIDSSGGITFRIPLGRMHWKGQPREIWPFALLEFPVSVMRLAARVLERWGGAASQVLVDFVFVDLRGWSLRGGSPRSPSGRFREPSIFNEADDLKPIRAFRFARAEAITEPDRCGLRLITFIYQAFGLGAEAIPPEFDRNSGVLAIPP